MRTTSKLSRRNLLVAISASALAGVSLMAWVRPGNAADTKPPSVQSAPGGWVATAPRDEIRPVFTYDSRGGPDGQGCLVITADRREGLDGWWTKSFPVTGGRHYRFIAHYRAEGIAVPRRSVVAEIHWRDAQGRKVPLDQPAVAGYLRGATAQAETEFPATRTGGHDGSTEVSDTYRAP